MYPVSIKVGDEEAGGNEYDLARQPLLSSSSSIDVKKQPHIHELQKPKLGECLCCRNFDLDNAELRAFYTLYKEANIMLPESSTDYNDVFRSLFMTLSDTSLPDGSIISEGWKKFGFQNKDPRKDIRGGGLLSLRQLLNFCEKHKKLALQMSEDDERFIFAITSINVTFFLKKLFHLADFLDIKIDKKDVCSRRGLKNFASMLQIDPDLLDKIHALIMINLFEKWLFESRKNTKITLLEFERAFFNLKKKFRAVVEGCSFNDFNQLKTKFENNLTNQNIL